MIRAGKRGKAAQVKEPFTFIHEGTTLHGDLRAEGRVRVHGNIYGNVEVRGVLEVAASGMIEGARIRAYDVKVLGSVKASVEAKGKIEIWKDGRLEGDVRACALDIEEGATFLGRSEMSPDGAAVGRLTEAATSLLEPESV